MGEIHRIFLTHLDSYGASNGASERAPGPHAATLQNKQEWPLDGLQSPNEIHKTSAKAVNVSKV